MIALPVALMAQLNAPDSNLPGEDGKDTSISVPNKLSSVL